MRLVHGSRWHYIVLMYLIHSHRANYVDGQLVSNKPGRPAEPEPCAGNDGTTIIVSDLSTLQTYPSLTMV